MSVPATFHVRLDPAVRVIAGAGADWTLIDPRPWLLLPLAGTTIVRWADGEAVLRRGMVYLHAGEPAVLRRSRRLRMLAWPLTGVMPAPVLAGVHADPALARAALSTRGRPLQGSDALSHGLAARTAELIERCPGRSAPVRMRLLQRLWRTRQQVMHGTDAQAELDALAAVAVLSKFHFVRCFSRMFGAPPGALRRESRLRHAAHQVAEPGLPLAAIAVANGFQHASSFARAFRRRYGVCASEARKEQERVKRS